MGRRNGSFSRDLKGLVQMEEYEKIKSRAVDHIKVSVKYKTPLPDLNMWVRAFILGLNV